MFPFEKVYNLECFQLQHVEDPPRTGLTGMEVSSASWARRGGREVTSVRGRSLSSGASLAAFVWPHLPWERLWLCLA